MSENRKNQEVRGKKKRSSAPLYRGGLVRKPTGN